MPSQVSFIREAEGHGERNRGGEGERRSHAQMEAEVGEVQLQPQGPRGGPELEEAGRTLL